jgi:transcriptional regulator with XRE-family HTH domain
VARKKQDPTPAELREREARYATIHDRIRLRRKELGISAAELARRCGVKTQAVQQWESAGEKATTPRRPMVTKIARILRITDEWVEWGPPKGYSTAAAEAMFAFEEDLRRKDAAAAHEESGKRAGPARAAASSGTRTASAAPGRNEVMAQMIGELAPDVRNAIWALVTALRGTAR